MTARSETVVIRDATAVYLEGELQAYEQLARLIDRDRPGAVSATPADWLMWHVDLRKQVAKLAEQTKSNLLLAEAAERQREGHL